MIARFFALDRLGTNVATEVRGGVTTFFVMAYIIFVNPAILALQGGPPFGAVVTATCLAAGLMTIVMGLYTNYPFALASGMGLNAVVAFELIATKKLPWPAAMGVIVAEGAIITLLVLTGFREKVMNAVPLVLKRAIGIGIGMFILLIGLVNAGFVKKGVGTPVTLGDVTELRAGIAALGLFLTLFLIARKVKAALLIGILGTTLIAVLVKAASPAAVVSAVPTAADLAGLRVQAIDLSTIGRGLDFSAFTLLGPLAASLAIFSLLLSDFFDTMGTVVGLGSDAGYLDEHGRLPRANRVLLVDSVAAFIGGLFGVSSVTTYIESGAGIAAGAKSGLASVVTGLLFLAAIVIAPVAGIVPPEATAPALIVVGMMMASAIKHIPFDDFAEGMPALLTIAIMPFTYSITNGIGAGFISYVFLRAAAGRAGELSPVMWLVAGAFVLYFVSPLLT